MAISAEIASIEADQAQKRDRAVRESTARDLNLRADKFEKLIPLWVDVLRDSAAAGELAKPVVGEGMGLYIFFKQIETQIPDAYRDIASQLRRRADEVLDERAPAILPTSEVSPPKPAPVERQRVFFLKDAKWHDSETQKPAYCERFDFAELPIELAEKALESGVAITTDSARIREVKHLRRGAPPDPGRCYDLDSGELPKAPAGPIPWDAFSRIDRGPPMKAFMPSPNLNQRPRGVRRCKTMILIMTDTLSRTRTVSFPPWATRDRAEPGAVLSCGAGLWPVAYHEAAHCIAWRYHGFEIGVATITPSLHFGGAVRGPGCDLLDSTAKGAPRQTLHLPRFMRRRSPSLTQL